MIVYFIDMYQAITQLSCNKTDGPREMGEDLADDFPPCEVLCYKDKHQKNTDYQHQQPTTWTHIGGSLQQQSTLVSPSVKT